MGRWIISFGARSPAEHNSLESVVRPGHAGREESVFRITTDLVPGPHGAGIANDLGPLGLAEVLVK